LSPSAGQQPSGRRTETPPARDRPIAHGGTQEGFRRRRTPGETVGGSGIDSELCARCRATSVANGDAEKVAVDTRTGAAAEPMGVAARTGSYQVVQLRLGSARC